jgi:hypothetical protein
MKIQSPTRPSTARRLAAAASGVLAIAFGSVSPASADVAAAIPSDALFAIKINGLQQVNDDFAALAVEWGLDQFQPELGDPLAAAQEEGDIQFEAVDLEGELALYFPANTDFDADEPPVVVVVPVSDYQAFVDGNFEDVRDEDGMQVGKAFGEDEDVYVVQRDGYAAFSPFKSSLEGFQDGLELAGPTEMSMTEQDVIVYANFSSLAPILKQAIDDEGGKDAMMEEIAEAFEDGDVPEGLMKYRPVVNAGAGQLYAVVESFLRDAEAATISVDFIPEAGIGTGVIAQFKDGSYLADTFGDLPVADGSLLSGLPMGDYLFFGGSTADPDQGVKLFNDLAGPVIAELEQVAEDDGVLTEFVGVIRTFIEAGDGNRFGLMAPNTQMFGQAPLIQQVLIQTGDAEALMQATKRAAELNPQLMEQLAAEAGEPGELPTSTTTFEDDAKEIGGVSFSKSTTTLPAGDPGTAMMMNMVFGPEGPTSYLATTGDSFITVAGLNDEQIAAVVEAVQADASPLADAPGMAAVQGELMAERTGVFYLNVGEIARAGLGAAQAFGQAPPIQIPQGLPPIAYAVGPADNSLMITGIVPKDLVSQMIVTALQFQQGMGGPGGGL